jgi:small conductance mechanosensitive channel
MDVDKFYGKASDWLISFGPRLVLATVIFFVGLWLIKKFSKFVSQLLSKRRIDQSLRPFLTGSLSLILQVLLVFAVMQIIGIQLTVFAALIGAVGVAGGLALSGTLQNFTSGILILLLKPFRAGDNIIAQGEEGTVATIRIFYTIVTTFDNRTVIIPNSKLSNEVIINLSREGKRRLDIELSFDYVQPFENIKGIIEKTISSNIELLKEPVCRIGISKLEKDSYKVMINVWVNAHGYLDIKMKLQESLMNELMRPAIKSGK